MSENFLKTGKSKLIIVCLINLLAVSAVFMTQSIFLELSESFKIDISLARYSFSAVSLFYAIAFIFLGPATDRYNLPRISLTGLILLSITIYSASYMGDFRLFVIAMALIGFFAALIPASMFPHMAKTAPKNKMGVYMGSIVASGTLGVIFGRVIMGLLTSHFGWAFSFRIVSCIFLIFSGLTYLSLVRNNNAISNTSTTLKELYEKSIHLLFNPKILSLLLAGFFLFTGFLGMVTFLTYRLIGAPFYFSAGEVGWISFAGITSLIAPFAGNLSQKTGSGKILFGSLLLCLLSVQLMGWFESVFIIILGLLLLFLGVYIFQPVLFIIVGKNAADESIGSASSLYIFFCIGGGSLSSIFLGPVWRSSGWQGVSLLCSVSVFISLLIVFLILRPQKRNTV